MELFIGLAALLLAAVWAVLPGRPTPAQRAPFQYRNFAHRGLHTPDKAVPENSLPAFEAAAAMGYGIELDVQLSQDGQVVVFHDDTLDRVAGVHGRVDAYPLKELQAMKLCGTGHTIPLFTQVLQVVAGRGPLIVELKTGRRNAELCQKTLEILRGYTGQFCIESFDPTIVAWFRRNAPDVLRGQLANSAGSYNMGAARGFVLSRCLGNFLARPQFIAWGPGPKNAVVRLAEGLGAMRVRWTVRPEDAPEAQQAACDAVIFEFYRPPAQW